MRSYLRTQLLQILFNDYNFIKNMFSQRVIHYFHISCIWFLYLAFIEIRITISNFYEMKYYKYRR